MPRVLLIPLLVCAATLGLRRSSDMEKADLRPHPSGPTERVIFGAGCFWGVEARFAEIPGVVRTRTGYSGGTTADPTYEKVCSHRTGHAEVVEVEYDPQRLRFEELLEVFWECHDPAKPARPDGGGQYRSAIFFTSAEQAQIARQSAEKLQASGKLRGPITTQIAATPVFYPAEEYHQRYFEKGRASCKLP
jgi:methionine-S-sulfoxide reductase